MKKYFVIDHSSENIECIIIWASTGVFAAKLYRRGKTLHGHQLIMVMKMGEPWSWLKRASSMLVVETWEISLEPLPFENSRNKLNLLLLLQDINQKDYLLDHQLLGHEPTKLENWRDLYSTHVKISVTCNYFWSFVISICRDVGLTIFFFSRLVKASKASFSKK
jgi:hypothetical protein